MPESFQSIRKNLRRRAQRQLSQAGGRQFRNRSFSDFCFFADDLGSSPKSTEVNKLVPFTTLGYQPQKQAGKKMKKNKRRKEGKKEKRKKRSGTKEGRELTRLSLLLIL